VTSFTHNIDFFGGNTFAQEPIYAVQGHILYTFQSGIWMALGGLDFVGGRTALNGVNSDNEQANTRAGFTLALPLDRRIQRRRCRLTISWGRWLLRKRWPEYVR